MFWRIVRFFASLKLAITLLIALAVLLILSTWTSVDPTNGALRRDFYHAWWFNTLLGLLALNIICVVLVRLPRLKIWDIGFVTTHFGVLTILFGAMLSSNFKIYGYMALKEGGKADFIELEDERQLRISLMLRRMKAQL